MAMILEELMENEQAVLEALLLEAKRRGITEQDVVRALARVLIHNEEYRQRPSRRRKNTAYDQFLSETQPPLALAWDLLRKPRGHETRRQTHSPEDDDLTGSERGVNGEKLSTG